MPNTTVQCLTDSLWSTFILGPFQGGASHLLSKPFGFDESAYFLAFGKWPDFTTATESWAGAIDHTLVKNSQDSTWRVLGALEMEERPTTRDELLRSSMPSDTEPSDHRMQAYVMQLQFLKSRASVGSTPKAHFD